jgi:hypothetical protein
MKNTLYTILLLVIVSISLTSCELIGDIFKAGVWVGILAVVAVIGLIIFLISKLSGKK